MKSDQEKELDYLGEQIRSLSKTTWIKAFRPREPSEGPSTTVKDFLQAAKLDESAPRARRSDNKNFFEAYVAEIQKLYDAWYLIGHTLLKERVAVMDTIIISLYSCLLVFEPTATKLSSDQFVPPIYSPTNPPSNRAVDSLKDLLPKIKELLEPLLPYDETAQSISGILRPLYSELHRGELDLLLLDQEALAWATIKSIYRRQELVGWGYDYDLRKKVNLEPSHAPVTTLRSCDDPNALSSCAGQCRPDIGGHSESRPVCFRPFRA
ncbi:hypothetical protein CAUPRSCDRAFT_11196 [Caulochytrium protostelioides]|uniref:Uncharacterized protein n=1 Tax=Caulochytrium protostelioides TaxID=1555241 RepID=A0A4P9WXP3_9FUNG|nr:hypothetical protein CAUPRSCDRAFT_11196 [Caulochytrium protostelioides]